MEPDDARAPRGAQRVGVWMALIVIAAAACALANSIGVLVAWRAVWGLGNALFIATALAVIGSAATGGQQGDGSDNPVLLEAGDQTVGVLTYSYNVANAGLSEELSSHPWMEKHMWFAQKKAGIEAQAKQAREQGADVVVAVVHWGAEYSIPPRPEQEQLANQLLKGDQVDAIFGHHAHLPQPCATINDKTVFYGLGNFLSAQRKKPTNNFPPQVQDGMIAGITFTADGGGKVSAARRPVHGRDAVARFLVGILGVEGVENQGAVVQALVEEVHAHQDVGQAVFFDIQL